VSKYPDDRPKRDDGYGQIATYVCPARRKVGRVRPMKPGSYPLSADVDCDCGEHHDRVTILMWRPRRPGEEATAKITATGTKRRPRRGPDHE
jgi:hypothetical protein